MRNKVHQMLRGLAKCPRLAMVIVLVVMIAPLAASAEEEPSLADIAQQTNNPVSSLWLLFIQNDMTIKEGDITDGDRMWNSFKFQPVAPFLLTDNIRLINRPVFQLNSFETPEPGAGGLDWNRETGLGDTILLQALAPADMDKVVWGVGWTHIFPTASDETLGLEKWAIGPGATAFYLGDKWVLGGIFQHWWDYAGDNDRKDVNLTDFQYVIRYKINPLTQIGCGPNIQYDWEDDQLSFPIGIGMDSTTMIGSMPFRYGFDMQYYIEQDDDFGPQWNFRLFFIPVIHAPGWAKKPLFGNSAEKHFSY